MRVSMMKTKVTKAQVRAVARYRADNKAHGKCIYCGNVRGANLNLCDWCVDRTNTKRREVYNRYKVGKNPTTISA